MPADDQIFGEAVVLVELHIRLRDVIAGLFHRREVDDLVRHLAIHDAAVRAFDEAVLVHARERGQAVDKADIRAFRRLDRADPAVMGRMHVANLEACALARQAARPKRREAPLVGDLRQRVGLVHELAELRGAEELAHRSARRLRVDQILRHHRVDIDRGHALADRPLHAQQPQPVLVLHQLAHRAHPAVAEIVDVVHLAAPVAQIDQRANHRDDVFLGQDAHLVRLLDFEPDVHLHAADRGKVVALLVEEQALEQRARCILRRGLAGAHDAVDVEQRVLLVLVLVVVQRVADEGAGGHVIDVEHGQFVHIRGAQLVQHLGVEFVAGFGVNLARGHVDDIFGQIPPMQRVVGNRDRLHLLGKLAHRAGVQLLASLDDNLAGVGVVDVLRCLNAAHALGDERRAPALRRRAENDALVESAEDLLVVHAERVKQRRRGKLALPVDRAKTMSLASNSKSSQEPRYGMMRAANRSLPEEWLLPPS